MNKEIKFALVVFATTGSMLTQAALVGEWNFDSQTFANTGTSGSIHDGTFMNETNRNPTFSTDTKFGSGYSLKIDSISDIGNDDALVGGEFLQINNSKSTDGVDYDGIFDSSTFTISMWVKTTDNDWSTWDEMGGKGAEGSGTGWSMRAHSYSAAGGTRFNSYGAGGGNAQDGAVDVNMLDMEWHLITGTYDGTAMSLYLDGALAASVTSTINDASLSSLVFGARDLGNRGEDLLFDSIQYYDTALDATEVAALAAIPEPATLGLIAAFGGGLLFIRRFMQI